MIKNNKHLYILSGLMILVAIVIRLFTTSTEGGFWLSYILFPTTIFLIVLGVVFFLMAFIRNQRNKTGAQSSKPLNPMILIVVGIIIALIVKLDVFASLSGIKFPLYLVGAGVFLAGFFSLVKKMFSGKLER